VTGDDFLALVRRRFSCRCYRPEPVPDNLLAQLLDAVQCAPSACNKQPWRLAIVSDEARRFRLCDEGLLPGMQRPWIREAPVLMVLGVARTTVTHRLAPLFSGIDYPALDLGIAGEHLVLQATALGLGTCWIGWIRPPAVRRIVDWPRSVQPVSLISVGWPAESAESHPTGRKPVLDWATGLNIKKTV
jgi:nitroreductase